MKDHKAFFKRAESTKKHWIHIWTINLFENYARYKGYCDQDPPPSLTSLFKKHMDQPAIVMASGPSANDALPYLSKWKGVIFCGPLHLVPLLANGVRPSYVCLYDALPGQLPEVDLKKLSLEDTSLITCPVMDFNFIESWPSKKFLYFGISANSTSNKDRDLTFDEFMEKYKPNPDTPISNYWKDEFSILSTSIQVRAYGTKNPFMKVPLETILFNVGSTSNNQIVVANFMGCRPVFLIGFDLCYVPNGPARIGKYELIPETGKYSVHIPITPPKKKNYGFPKGVPYVIENGRVVTEEMLGYRHSLMYLYPHNRIQLIQVAGDRSSLNGVFPQISIEELIETQGKGYEKVFRTSKERHNLTVEYLQHMGLPINTPSWLNTEKGDEK